jgi:DNA-binding transcriptional LysR family regulator
MLTIPQLRAFSAVARYLHFTRAAEELLVAQPSVSYHVRELERMLGVQLVEIVGRKVHLTDAGERLAERATGLLNELDTIEQELRDYGRGLTGRLRLGATRTVGGYALPPVLASFGRTHPRIELKVTIGNSAAIERMLTDRMVDLAVVEWKMSSSELVSSPLRRDALVLVAPRDHPLAARDRITLNDLRGEAFVMREAGSGTRGLAEQALGSALPDIRVVLELEEPEAIVRVVEAGVGLAFMAGTIASRHLVSGALAVLNVEGVNLWRDFSLVVLRNRVFTPAMRSFAEHIVEAWK